MAIDWYENISPYYLTDVDGIEHPPGDKLRLDDEVIDIHFLRDVRVPPWLIGPVDPPEEGE